MKPQTSLKIFIIAVFCAGALSGCLKVEDPPSAEELLQRNINAVNKTKLASDLAAIDDSLEVWNIVPFVEPHGVRYTIEEAGTGTQPKLESYVSVKYVGRLLSTKAVFDQSNSATFRLADLIIAWQTTLPHLNVGTKATLYVPSGYGYGTYPAYDNNGAVIIPANSNLIFEIEILDVLQ